MRYRVVALLVVALAGAVVVAQQGPQLPIQASGTWQTDDGAFEGDWTATLYLAGSDINGAFDLQGFPEEISSGHFSGTVVDGVLQFGVLTRPRFENQDPTVATFVGSFSGSGISGTFTTPSGFVGTWIGGQQ